MKGGLRIHIVLPACRKMRLKEVEIYEQAIKQPANFEFLIATEPFSMLRIHRYWFLTTILIDELVFEMCLWSRNLNVSSRGGRDGRARGSVLRRCANLLRDWEVCVNPVFD